ncbi:MAG: hypothetical protein ACLUIQ_06920 [Dialister invisus]
MSGIQAPDKETMEACRLYVDNLIKPIHSGKAGGYSSQAGGDYRKNKTWKAE